MAARLKRVTFSPVDTTWLRMDRLTNKMMITGVMMFEQPLDLERVRETIRARMLVHERFRQRVRESPFKATLPHWEDDPHFDLNAHVQRVALPAPGDSAALQELVSDIMSTPLDYSRPLWHYHVVENFEGGSAVIGRLHHCIGDGVALVQVLLGMTDDMPDDAGGSRPKPRARDVMARDCPPSAGLRVPGVRQLVGAVVGESWATLKRPAHAGELAKQGQELAEKWARQGADVVAATGKLLLTLPDRMPVFRGSCGVSKHAAWSEPFPLDDVKAIGKRLGGTVNDVLLAAVSGALRRYLEDRGESTDGVQMNAMVPVNLRPPREEGKLGNRFGLVILTLPVGTRDPVERLVILKRRMDDIKHSPEALVAYAMLNGIGLVPLEAERLVVDFFATKTSAVMTNVRGPSEPLYMAGSRMKNLMFWVPVTSGTGMGISIMSYAGTAMVGIMTDACMVPDPIKIAENFNTELHEMARWLAPEQLARAEAEIPLAEEQHEMAAETGEEPASAEQPAAAEQPEAEEEVFEVEMEVLEVDVDNEPDEEAAELKEAIVAAAETEHDDKTSSTRKRKAAKAIEEAPAETGPQ